MYHSTYVLFTHLHTCRATSEGHAEVVKLMLRYSISEPLPNLCNNETPLLAACKKSLYDIALLLLEHSPKLVFVSEAHNNLSPLHVACSKGDSIMVELLLQALKTYSYCNINTKVNLDFRDNLGCTPLYTACHHGHVDVVIQLVEFQREDDSVSLNVNVASENMQRTPLHVAVQTGRIDIVRLLLTVQDIEVNLEGKPSSKTQNKLIDIYSRSIHGCVIPEPIKHRPEGADSLCNENAPVHNPVSGTSECMLAPTDAENPASLSRKQRFFTEPRRSCKPGILEDDTQLACDQISMRPSQVSFYTETSKKVAKVCQHITPDDTPLKIDEGREHSQLEEVPLEAGQRSLRVYEDPTTGKFEFHRMDSVKSKRRIFDEISITPLAEACACAHKDIMKLLLVHGACDNNGLACRIAYLIQCFDLIKLILSYQTLLIEQLNTTVILNWHHLKLPLCKGDWLGSEAEFPWINSDLRSNCNGDDTIKATPLVKVQYSAICSVRLDSNQLSSVPIELFQLQNVREIDISYNKVTKLPTGPLKRSNSDQVMKHGWLCCCLEVLNASQNRLTSIPICVWQLPHLRRLYLSNNRLTTVFAEEEKMLPEASLSLSLEIIDISSNLLKGLVSSSLFELPNLCNLDLSSNVITELPHNLWKCNSLLYLDISNNQLLTLPLCHSKVEQSCQSKCTEPLTIGHSFEEAVMFYTETSFLSQPPTAVQKVSPDLESNTECSSLLVLNLSNNKLSMFPRDVVYFAPNLTSLCVSRNPIKQLDGQYLHVSTLRGKEDMVLTLIEEFNFNINNSDQGRMLLHSACSVGNLSLVRKLICEHNADVNAKDDQGNTPLDVAVLYSQEPVASALIQKKNRSMLHIACSVGNVTFVQSLVQLGANVNLQDDEGNTPVHVAALCGREEVTLVLINTFKCDINLRGHLGRSLLHCACRGSSLSLIRVLILEHQADIHFQDDDQNTPLHIAALYGREAIVLALINEFGCDHNVKGHCGRSLLHNACNGGNISLVQSLILEYKAGINAQDDQGNTPLHIAALCGVEEVFFALLNKFQCNPSISTYDGRSLLHSACAGGNASIARNIATSNLVVDSHGDTPLHTCAALGHCECVEALLSNGTPILMRNNAGKTAIDVAVGEAKVLCDDYMNDNKNKIYREYDAVIKVAEKRYSKAERITRIFVIGNPGAGKSSLIESLKREEWIDNFRPVSESSVPPHTAGIQPSIYSSRYCGRMLFYDFAGDQEYYSSHAAILENLSSSRKCDNMFIIVVDLREDISKIKDVVYYWISFIQYQKFSGKELSLVVAGSHSDLIAKKLKKQKEHEFQSMCSGLGSDRGFHNIECFVLHCCKPKSKPIGEIQQHISELTKDSPCYNLSLQASLLLGLIEKDFSNVISCSIQQLISHIKDTGIHLPMVVQSLQPILSKLHDIGLCFMITGCNRDKSQIVFNTSKLTNEVHRLLFSKEGKSILQKGSDGKPYFNIGIVPQSSLESVLPEYITIDCLVQLQYCQEIKQEDIGIFSLPNSTGQSFLFFPALCTAAKNKESWSTAHSVKYSIGWQAHCTNPHHHFPPRFLHVLLL